jgi:PAS domain S-box-containing protein
VNARGTPLQNIAVALAYLVTALLGFLLAFEGTNATAVWPPAGIALAAVLLVGYGVWPGILVGAFLANMFVLSPGFSPTAPAFVAAIGTAAGNVMAALCGAYLVRRFIPVRSPFDSTPDAVRFILLAAVVSPLISATIGTVSFSCYSGDWLRGGQIWLTWWLGDAVGVLVFAPLLLTWEKRRSLLREKRSIMEAVALLALIVLFEAVVFLLKAPVGYLIFLVLFWTALRFGQFETAVTVTLVMLSFLAWTVTGVGPFAAKTLNSSLLFLQSYLGVAAISTLLLSTLVNARNLAEEALRISEEKFRSIFEKAPIGIFQSTRDGRFTSINGTLAAMFRYSSPQEMITEVRNVSRQLFVSPEQRDNIISRALNAPTYVSEEVAYRRRDGSKFIANLYMRLLRDGSDNEADLEGFVEDITERKRAEESLRIYQENLEKLVRARTSELQEANERLTREIEERGRTERNLIEREAQYRDLVESANCVVLRWLPDGRIIFFNRFAQSFFGYREEEVLGRSIIGTLIPLQDSTGHELTSLAADIVAHPEAYSHNINENMRKSGELVWVAWTNKPIPAPDGSIGEILSIGIDITQLVHTEQELRRTLDELERAKERAESADHLKSAFLATMSHELRTPLNSIIGFTGILLQGLSGPINEEQVKQLGMVKSSANHLLSLISDVLDISKIEAGQLKVEHEPFSLRDSILKVVQSVRPLAEKKGLDLSFDVAEEVGNVTGDGRRVEQVLLNLLSNSLKFTEQGGIRVSCGREGAYFLTSVADSGIGIANRDREHLFKPFHQVDTGLSRKYEGTGLGLSICKKLVELMGGEIRVVSSPGKGSTFGFTLPVERKSV